jgi:N-acyl-D-aspartate/D-glutamate deacylase
LTLGLVQDARDTGLDVTVDQYPYAASSTGLANILPAWARAGTRDEFRARLDDPDTRARIKAESVEKLYGFRAAGDLDRITVASFPKFPEYVGKTLKEVTVSRGYEATIENGAEVAMELLYEGSGSAIYHVMVEEDVRRIMRAPFTHIASDGSAVAYGDNVPHLRNYGAFARVLKRYVVDAQVLTVEEAIHKMAGMPAARMGLTDRGLIAKGAVADLNVFALENIEDNDDWANPHQYSKGFDFVIVNGVLAIEEGVRTTAMPGQALKHSGLKATMMTQ